MKIENRKSKLETRNWKRVAFLLASGFWLLTSFLTVAFATDAATATDLPAKGLNPQTVIAVAILVSAAVEVAKRLLKVQGRISVVVNLVAAIAAIYAVAPPDAVLSLTFLVTAIQSVLTSAGVFATVSTVKGG